jgi:hypothetical protein
MSQIAFADSLEQLMGRAKNESLKKCKFFDAGTVTFTVASLFSCNQKCSLFILWLNQLLHRKRPLKRKEGSSDPLHRTQRNATPQN